MWSNSICPAGESSFASSGFRRILHRRRTREKWSKFLKTQESLPVRRLSLSLTPLELDIMKAVWRLAPATVKDVQDAIHPWRPLAYTTVMTIMSRLHAKGFLDRSLRTRTHYYAPTVDFTDVRDAAVARIVAQFFEGSRENLLRFLDTASFEMDPHLPPDLNDDLPSPSLDETLL